MHPGLNIGNNALQKKHHLYLEDVEKSSDQFLDIVVSQVQSKTRHTSGGIFQNPSSSIIMDRELPKFEL